MKTMKVTVANTRNCFATPKHQVIMKNKKLKCVKDIVVGDEIFVVEANKAKIAKVTSIKAFNDKKKHSLSIASKLHGG